MIDASTRPILVAYTGRTTGLVHFASGGGRTIPYCQGLTRSTRHESPEQVAAHAAQYALVPPGRFMDCTACAELIYQHPAWRPNHFPLMLTNLRWI